MSVLSTDLKFKYSGGASNNTPANSLGGAISSYDITDNSMNNLFDDVTGDQHLAGDINYRCIFIKNDSAEVAYNIRFWVESDSTSAETQILIGGEPAYGAPVQTIANENTAPSGITFDTHLGQANGINISNLGAGLFYAIWIKRVVTAGTTPQASDTATLKVYCDTL